MGSLCPGPRPSQGHPGPGAVDKARDGELHSQWPPCPWRGWTPARESAAVGQAGVGRVTQPGRLGSVAAPKPSVHAPISDTGATLPSWQRGAQGTRALPLKQAECLASLAGPRCSGPLPGESQCQGGQSNGLCCPAVGRGASHGGCVPPGAARGGERTPPRSGQRKQSAHTLTSAGGGRVGPLGPGTARLCARPLGLWPFVTAATGPPAPRMSRAAVSILPATVCGQDAVTPPRPGQPGLNPDRKNRLREGPSVQRARAGR